MLESFLGRFYKRPRLELTQNSNTENLTIPPAQSLPVLDQSSSVSQQDSIVCLPTTIDSSFNLNERFVAVLDQLDVRAEKFRKDAHGLQEKKDFLWMSIDLIKSNESLQKMNESEREEIICYIQRISSRLSTVELNVRTVRDTSQEDSLCQINTLIDMLITIGDPVLSRQRCQQYLNACSSSSSIEAAAMSSFCETSGNTAGHDEVIVDKKFENALLGCTLDDQKNIKKRLHALMGYLNKQMVRD